MVNLKTFLVLTNKGKTSWKKTSHVLLEELDNQNSKFEEFKEKTSKWEAELIECKGEVECHSCNKKLESISECKVTDGRYLYDGTEGVDTWFCNECYADLVGCEFCGKSIFKDENCASTEDQIYCCESCYGEDAYTEWKNS